MSTWVKGQSGNPMGRHNKPFHNALVLTLKREGENMPALARIAQMLINKAEKGDLEAAKLLVDRLDGKALQVVEQNITQLTIESMSADELKTRIAALEKRLALKQSAPLLIEAKPVEAVDRRVDTAIEAEKA